KESGRISGVEGLTLTAIFIQPGDGLTYRLRTSSAHYDAPGSKKRDAATIGGSSAAGAVIGAIAEGGKGAAVGAAAGAGAGTVMVLATDGKPVKLPFDTLIRFVIEKPAMLPNLGRAPVAAIQQQTDETDATSAVQAAPPGMVALAAGTPLPVKLLFSLNSNDLKNGQSFEAELADPVSAGGRLAAPAGSMVKVLVTDVKEAGRVTGVEGLTLTLTALDPGQGRTYRIKTTSASSEAPGSKKRDAATIGGTSAAGAVIGAIAKGGKGAVAGAAAGAAAGTVVVLSTEGKPVKLPAGTVLWFTLEAALNVTDLGPAP
ncbi:hypothetical protein ACFLU6_13345, partial [Acidobacteriota bacterium]